ncbi:hypothetical protein ACQEVX_05395 [Streptomyces syringium]|uniref:hypothetical protein n=1 Tax=Streptomyces syringium TaxID=76729 RepID=UPI003D8AEC71
MTGAPVPLTFTPTKSRFQFLTATGRHGEHQLTEEAFTWSYTLIRTDGRTVTANAGFREVAEDIAQAVENAINPDARQVRAIAHQIYRAHLADTRRI